MSISLPITPPRRMRQRPTVISPKNDNQYFEELTRAMFQAGMDWDVIRNRWPRFQTAFKRFDVTKVSRFSPDDLDYLLSADSGVIRNFRKVTATLENAMVFLSIKKEFGSFKAYLRSFDGQPYAVKVRDMKKRFKHVGDTGAFVFLYTVKESVPAWADRKLTPAPRDVTSRPSANRRAP